MGGFRILIRGLSEISLFALGPRLHNRSRRTSRSLRPTQRQIRGAKDPVGNRYLEMIVAIDAANYRVRHLSKIRSGSNMNLLFGLAARALHHHHNMPLIGHGAGSPFAAILPCRVNGTTYATSPHAATVARRREAASRGFTNTLIARLRALGSLSGA